MAAESNTGRKGGEILLGQASLPLWQRALLFSAAYFLCAATGSFLSVRDSTYVSFWLPAGLYVAVLLLNERRAWPWLVLAAFPANLVFDLLQGTKLITILFFYCANTIQAVTGAWLVRRFVAERPTLATLKEFFGLLCFAVVLSTVPGAAIGAATLTGSGLSQSFAQSYKVWWGSNALVILLLLPLILAWFSSSDAKDTQFSTPKKLLEAALVLLLLVALTWHLLVFDKGIMSPNKGRLLLPLLWAGLRFGLRGAAAANLLLALSTTFLTSHFVTGLTPEQIASGQYVFTLHTSLAVASVVGLIPALILRERDRTTAELRESQERFRNLTAASFEGIGISEDGRIVDVNDQFLKMFGYKREEIIGQEVIELVAPESRSIVSESIRLGREEISEHRLQRKDGTFFYAEARAKTVRVGQRSLRMAALRDITERKQSEQALRDSETRLRTLAEASFEGIGVSKDGIIVDANEQLLKMLGYARSELMGRPVSDLVAPESRELVRHMMESAQVEPYEHWSVRKDGTVFPVEVCGRTVARHPHHIRLSAIRDITERKQAEAALRASEESLRATIEHTPLVAVQWYDAQGRVLFWNQASESMYGWTAAEAMGKQLAHLIFAPAEASVFEQAFTEVATTGKPVGPIEFTVRRRDGSRGIVLSTVFQIPVATGTPRFACMDVDVTEQKRAETDRARFEAQLHQAQKMQSLGTLAGGIAHDFNNILTAILGNVRLAVEDVSSAHPARQSLDQIEKAALRASDLVRRILAFSRQQELHRKVLKLQPVVEEASKLLRSSLPARIDIRTHLSDDVPRVLADPTQIHQVVMNLGTNAAHAIGEQTGLIEIRLDVVTVDTSLTYTFPDLTHGLHVRLSVSDNGCGMDKDTLERVFEPFFTTKASGLGIGLGLSVVHGIVKGHEGAITVDSKPGLGTTFHLYFPAVSEANTEPTSHRREIERGQSQHILYVDDEEPLVYLATRMLERLSYRVSGFSDPTHAMHAFRLRPYDFDIVVSDLSMPKMSGTDLAVHIMKIRPEIPIILTSGCIRSEDVQAAQTLGITDLILKPNTIEELSHVLHQLLVEKKKPLQSPPAV